MLHVYCSGLGKKQNQNGNSENPGFNWQGNMIKVTQKESQGLWEDQRATGNFWGKGTNHSPKEQVTASAAGRWDVSQSRSHLGYRST